jgi:hypothetical protein
VFAYRVEKKSSPVGKADGSFLPLFLIDKQQAGNPLSHVNPSDSLTPSAAFSAQAQTSSLPTQPAYKQVR